MSTDNFITSYFKSASVRKRPLSLHGQQEGFRRSDHHQRDIVQPTHRKDIIQPTHHQKGKLQPNNHHQPANLPQDSHQSTKPQKGFRQPPGLSLLSPTSSPYPPSHSTAPKSLPDLSSPLLPTRYPEDYQQIQAIRRTEDAITDVVSDLSQYISRNKSYVNHGKVKLLEKHGALDLRERIPRGMPTTLKKTSLAKSPALITTRSQL